MEALFALVSAGSAHRGRRIETEVEDVPLNRLASFQAAPGDREPRAEFAAAAVVVVVVVVVVAAVVAESAEIAAAGYPSQCVERALA